MNYLSGEENLEYKGMTFKASTAGLQLQEHADGYMFCSRYSEVTPTVESSVDVCKEQCRGCWILTYYAGLQTPFAKRCYVFMSAEECGLLQGYKDGTGSIWSVPVGIYNSSGPAAQRYRAHEQAVVWPGKTLEMPEDYFSGALGWIAVLH
jgi:hypothetical protein